MTWSLVLMIAVVSLIVCVVALIGWAIYDSAADNAQKRRINEAKARKELR